MKSAKLWIRLGSILLLFFIIKTPVFAGDVVINEFLPNPSGPTSEDTEWIELYNTTTISVDLSGWQIDDIAGGGTSPYTLPSGTVILGNSFLVFEKSATNVGLNNGGDSVRLISATGIEVDIFSYTSTTEDVSYGRQNDGSSQWITFSSPTKGSSNNTSAPAPTATLAPSPTVVPTETPMPTKTPTPTKIPTPTKTPTPVPTSKQATQPSSILTVVPSEFPTSVVAGSSGRVVTKAVLPTAVLAAAIKRETPAPTKSVKVTETSGIDVAKVLMGIGGLLLTACGILAYRSYGKRFYERYRGNE